MMKKQKRLSRVMNRSLLVCSTFALSSFAMLASAENNVEQNLNEVTVSSQQRAGNITVTVVDKAGDPVVGASVIVRSTKSGGITDLDGKVSVNASQGELIQVSYVGFTTLETRVNGSAVRVQLSEDQALLDEVVVVGYGTMRKSDLTGSVATTKGEEIIKQ